MYNTGGIAWELLVVRIVERFGLSLKEAEGLGFEWLMILNTIMQADTERAKLEEAKRSNG